jgi:hypothetical protein
MEKKIVGMPPPHHGKRLLVTCSTRSSSPSHATNNQNKRLKKNIEEVELGSLPDDLVCGITSYLNAESLLTVRLLNTSFRDLASTGAAGWEGLCHYLWKDKVHIPPAAANHPDPMAAYRLSFLDSRLRDYITRDELTYDPHTKIGGTIWSFRFKESAGSDWTSFDPWYNGLPCRKLVFLRDGTVKEYTERENDDDGPQAQLENPQFHRSARVQLVDPPMSMTWRFLVKPLDLPARPTGSYIRFTVGGRDIPTYVVRRSPTLNWGFLMESCWGVYASFELPKQIGRRRGRRRVRRYQDTAGNWCNVEIEDDEASLSDSEKANDKSSLLTDDSWFSITSGVQWREAYLYNFGARVLPEGDEADATFERAYGATLHT